MDVTQGLRNAGPPSAQRPLVTGYVSRSQPAPAAFGDPLFVILPTLSPDYTYGPCRWAAEQGSVLPQQGAEVLVAFDDLGSPVVVWWDGVPVALATEAALTALTGRVTTLEADRRVRGTISATGTITSGSGFTVSHTGTGTYAITFTTPFSAAPSVTFGLGATSSTAGIRHTAARTASGFSVVVYTTAGTAIDGEFDFIAEGPA